MKRHYWILLIVVIALGVRILFYAHTPGYLRTGDTVSYYLTAKIMIDRGILVDHWRTPVYPIILALPYVLSGQPMASDPPGVQLSRELLTVRIAQAIGGVVAVVLLFFLLTAIGISDRTAGFFCLFMAVNRTLIAFEHTLLTEAFSTLWVIGVSYLVICLMKQFRVWGFVFLVGMLLVGVFLRPSYVAFPLLVFGVLAWYHRKRVVNYGVFIGIAAYAGALFLYMSGNAAQYQYFGVSRIGDANMLGKILTLQLHADGVSGHDEMKAMLREYYVLRNIPNPWQVYVQYPKLYDPPYAAPMGAFVRSVLIANMGEFLWKSTLLIPQAMTDVSEFSETIRTTKRFEGFFSLLKLIYREAQAINFILFVGLPLALVEAWRKKTIQKTAIAFLGLVSLYHIVLGVYLGYADYGRLLSVAQPVLYFFSLYWWWRIIKEIYRRIHV